MWRTVWVRWDSRVLRVFNHRWEQIALHVRREPGRFSTLGEHVPHEKISSVERGAAWLLGKLRVIGPHSERWAQAMLAQRGIEAIREAIRFWVNKFGPLIAANIRRRRVPPTGRWHLDEVVVKIKGRRMWLWRAVDDEGEVLDVLERHVRETMRS